MKSLPRRCARCCAASAQDSTSTGARCTNLESSVEKWPVARICKINILTYYHVGITWFHYLTNTRRPKPAGGAFYYIITSRLRQMFILFSVFVVVSIGGIFSYAWMHPQINECFLRIGTICDVIHLYGIRGMTRSVHDHDLRNVVFMYFDLRDRCSHSRWLSIILKWIDGFREIAFLCIVKEKKEDMRIMVVCADEECKRSSRAPRRISCSYCHEAM